MTERRSFPEISPDLLRAEGQDARIERVWERLAPELSERRRRTVPPSWVAMSVAAAGIFGAGVLVGSWHAARVEPTPVAAVAAEPVPAARVSAAARAEAAPEPAPVRQVRPARALGRRTGAVTPEAPGLAPAASEEPTMVAAPPAPAEWKRLADEGSYVAALAALESTGGFEGALRDASADQLMSLVDIAKATGQRDRAILALRRVVSEHGTDPNAPVAAWMLGNELYKARDLPSAEQAFAMYRALSPGGDFAEDALARQVDIAAEQGHLEHARRLAGQYLKEFSDGPRRADILAQLEQWNREAEAEAPAPVPSEDPEALAPDASTPR